MGDALGQLNMLYVIKQTVEGNITKYLLQQRTIYVKLVPELQGRDFKYIKNDLHLLNGLSTELVFPSINITKLGEHINKNIEEDVELLNNMIEKKLNNRINHLLDASNKSSKGINDNGFIVTPLVQCLVEISQKYIHLIGKIKNNFTEKLLLDINNLEKELKKNASDKEFRSIDKRVSEIEGNENRSKIQWKDFLDLTMYIDEAKYTRTRISDIRENNKKGIPQGPSEPNQDKNRGNEAAHEHIKKNPFSLSRTYKGLKERFLKRFGMNEETRRKRQLEQAEKNEKHRKFIKNLANGVKYREAEASNQSGGTRRVKRGRKGTRRQRGGNPEALKAVCANLAVCLENQYMDAAKGDEEEENKAESKSRAAILPCIRGKLIEAKSDLTKCENAAAERQRQLMNFLKARMHRRSKA